MKQIGKSSLWVEKYRPKNFEDIISTPLFRNFLNQIKLDTEIPNLIFNGPAGTGKTSFAFAIVKELGADELYINASKDNSINDIRYKVQGFATVKSLMSDTTKIVILDEFDRLSPEAMDALKAMIEETHQNCRYIFITNKIQKIIEPLISRAQEFNFGTEVGDEKKQLIIQYFSRAKFILDQEDIEYDKKVVAKFVTELFPDFRKVLNRLQQYSKLATKIDDGIFNILDDVLVKDLVKEMKTMNFDVVQSKARGIDPASFYTSFYLDLKQHLKTECIPDMIMLLNEYNFRDSQVVDREINLVACLIDLMRAAKWR